MNSRESANFMLSEHFRKMFFNREEKMMAIRVQDPFSRTEQGDYTDNDALIPVSNCFVLPQPSVEFERHSLYKRVDIAISPILFSHNQISTVRNFKADVLERLQSTRRTCESIFETPARPIERLESELLLLRQKGIVYYYTIKKLPRYNPNALIAACIHSLRCSFDVLTGLSLLKLARSPQVLKIVLEQLLTAEGFIFARVFCLSNEPDVIKAVLPMISGLPDEVEEQLRGMHFELLTRAEQAEFAELLD